MREYKTGLKRVGGNEGSKCKHNARLDTYGCGCSHDCSYCYAKSLLGFRGLWRPDDPAVMDAGRIRKEVAKIKPDEVVRLGGMTDCFQPAERIYGATAAAVKALNEAGCHYLIVTKSATVADYMDVLDKDLAHIQVTVTTLDDDLCRTYEKASPPSERLKAIQTLQESGYDVQLRLSPYIPEYMDVDRLNGLGVDKICVEFLRVNSWICRWFDIDYSPYTVAQSGYHHMPLERKIPLIEKLTGFREITVCEDEDRAYTFWKQNVNHNRDDCCNLRKGKDACS